MNVWTQIALFHFKEVTINHPYEDMSASFLRIFWHILKWGNCWIESWDIKIYFFLSRGPIVRFVPLLIIASSSSHFWAAYNVLHFLPFSALWHFSYKNDDDWLGSFSILFSFTKVAVPKKVILT